MAAEDNRQTTQWQTPTAAEYADPATFIKQEEDNDNSLGLWNIPPQSNPHNFSLSGSLMSPPDMLNSITYLNNNRSGSLQSSASIKMEDDDCLGTPGSFQSDYHPLASPAANPFEETDNHNTDPSTVSIKQQDLDYTPAYPHFELPQIYPHLELPPSPNNEPMAEVVWHHGSPDGAMHNRLIAPRFPCPHPPKLLAVLCPPTQLPSQRNSHHCMGQCRYVRITQNQHRQ